MIWTWLDTEDCGMPRIAASSPTHTALRRTRRTMRQRTGSPKARQISTGFIVTAFFVTSFSVTTRKFARSFGLVADCFVFPAGPGPNREPRGDRFQCLAPPEGRSLSAIKPYAPRRDEGQTALNP